MATADKIYMKFLQYMHADRGATGFEPGILDQFLGAFALCRCVEVIALKQNIGVEKPFNVHELGHG